MWCLMSLASSPAPSCSKLCTNCLHWAQHYFCTPVFWSQHLRGCCLHFLFVSDSDDIQDRLSTYPASCKIGEDGQWTFPATGQVTSFPIVGKRLIPGRLQNTVHMTFGTRFPFLELVVILLSSKNKGRYFLHCINPNC